VQPGAELDAHIRDAGGMLARYRDLIQRLARIRLQDGQILGATQLVAGEATVMLSLKGHLDLDRERTRIQKDIDRAAAEIAKADKKLANADFVAKAPQEVVADLRERLAEETGRRGKLAAALKRLNEMNWGPS
jgi:valyl-tRNA synthetase